MNKRDKEATLRRSLIPLLIVPLLLMAGGQHALAGTTHRSTKPPANATTTTTVMGGGKPSTWPAAKPYPPSLAGAYSPNMKTAFLALTRYSDWVGSHPNPTLVRNYATLTANIYAAQVYLMRQMSKRGLHLSPTPTEVDFLAVIQRPVRRRSTTGKLMLVAGKPAYTSGIVDVVIRQFTEPYLNRKDRIVGYTARGTGPAAWTVTLAQEPTNGRFAIAGYYGVTLHGSLKQWEQRVARKK